MVLNAQQALSNLERATKAYLHAKDDHEATITLERAIARGDIEAANANMATTSFTSVRR